jgi:hypothetical protein
MAYVNTGDKRSLTFPLDKTIGGNSQLGYPKIYDGRLAFPGYDAITNQEAQELTSSQYTNRLAAFHSYVESIEPGFDSGANFTNASIVTDTDTCPPPPTTTTTTAAVTTTTVPVTTTTTTGA